MQRVLPITSGNNFRELGGYQTADGCTIKMHKIIRSGALHDLNDNDAVYLTKYGVKYDVDFRSTEERDAQPDRSLNGCTYFWDPVLKFDELENSVSLNKLATDIFENANTGYNHMISVYHNMIKKPDANQAYRKFFDYLLMNDQDQQVLLFHCTSGKDRTGIGAILFLSALDIPEETIKQDYLLTNQVTQNHLMTTLNQIKQKTDNDTLLTNVRYLLTVSEDYYQAAMDDIHSMAGTTINYLHKFINVTDDEINQLKKIYLV